jgi:hypothetical protein
LSLTKISILLQYRRVFVGSDIQRIITGSIGVIVVYGLWSVFATAFMCTPVSYFWNPSIGGHCLSRLGVWFANASLNIITDVVICLMPVPVLNRLSLPRKQKYALIAVFCLGLFVCLTSILRLKALYQISVSTDVTWDNTPAAYWSSLECNCSVVAACLPTVKLGHEPSIHSFPSTANKVTHQSRYKWLCQIRCYIACRAGRLATNSNDTN